MKGYLSVDPGGHSVGAAIWDHNHDLVKAWYFECRGRNDLFDITCGVNRMISYCGHEIREIAIEIPQVYDRRHSKGDPNDLIDVSLTAGAVCGAIKADHVVFYKPRQWKGQVPKEIHNDRVMSRLSDNEKKCIDWPKRKSLHHNVIDGIGIGLYHLRRY